MEKERRNFLKKAALAGASAMVVPSLMSFKEEENLGNSERLKLDTSIGSKLIVPKNNGLRITGTFLDEISHDIPHQNWGEKEWDLDFRYMKSMFHADFINAGRYWNN